LVWRTNKRRGEEKAKESQAARNGRLCTSATGKKREERRARVRQGVEKILSGDRKKSKDWELNHN